MLNIKQFPSGNWDVNGLFIPKKGTLLESAKHQLKLLKGRARYGGAEKETIEELKEVIIELNNKSFGGVF